MLKKDYAVAEKELRELKKLQVHLEPPQRSTEQHMEDLQNNIDGEKHCDPADMHRGDPKSLGCFMSTPRYNSDLRRAELIQFFESTDAYPKESKAVLVAHDDVIAAMKPGINWVDMHILVEKVILESLKKGNLLFGNLEDMMAQRLGVVFMPHGLGHLLGIDTHDPGGYLQGIERPTEPGLRSLRTALDLKEDMVITVELGYYFINALLSPAMESPDTSRFFNRDAIKRFEGFGGVRFESDLYVTSDGCINMTKVPRETWEIKAVMVGSPWPSTA